VLYRDITQVSVVGLRGTLYIGKTRDPAGVSVETTGPYEAKVAGDSWLVICPEGHELAAASAVRAQTPITAEGTHIGSVDVTASVQFGGRPRPRRRTRAAAGTKATVRITAPPGTRFELIGCRGARKGPGGWRFMEGTSRFTMR
jgi:hypothetical protein